MVAVLHKEKHPVLVEIIALVLTPQLVLQIESTGGAEYLLTESGNLN